MRLVQGGVIVAWILGACTSPTRDGVNGVGEGSGDSDAGPGQDHCDGGAPDAPPSTCAVTGAPGTIGPELELPPNAGAAVVVADRDGNVLYVGPDGVTKLDAALAPVYTYPHGEVVAVDDVGHAFVAGAFREPTEFGTGVLVPNDNVDVFLVELSPSGEVVFATQLGECGGDGVRSIAVARDGRIAISGADMGTVVTDAHGAIVFRLAPSGALAFDTHGELVIAGAFAGELDLGDAHRLSTTSPSDIDAFVARYDEHGCFDFGIQLGDAPLPVHIDGYGDVTTPRTQVIDGVATGLDDSIAITGAFLYEIDLFGATLTEQPSFPSGHLAGTFVAKLAADGSVVFARSTWSANEALPIGGLRIFSAPLAPSPGTAIAVDATGRVVVSANTPGNTQPPFAYPQLTRYDAVTGASDLSIGNTIGPAGYGLGVAIDGCANLVWARLENTPSLFFPHVFIAKLAP
ncbi:MAG TPA: hypothetical protein VFQ53_08730 [Kofleriaceae bacterium]|nr:hypothetical protein [Kofleriaceae bacterium]